MVTKIKNKTADGEGSQVERFDKDVMSGKRMATTGLDECFCSVKFIDLIAAKL